MVGGLLQLAVYGNEDIYLTGNPQITYFKSVYRRHTNFSMEHLNAEFIGDRGHLDYALTTTKKITCTLDVNGDLISNCYLVFRIPNVFTYKPDLAASPYRLRWVKNLGFNMIKSVSVMVGGKEIVKHSGEWLHVTNELTNTAEQKKVLNRLIGNQAELYDPTDSLGVYPDSLTTDNGPPSIRGRLIYVPLNFWFNTKPGLSLPIIALQYNKVELVVELNSLDSLYTLECNGIHFKPDLSVSSSPHNIRNFLVGKENSDLGWGLEPYVEVNYVYLDKAERKLFGELSHEYLIEQVEEVNYYGIKEDNYILELLLNHPTKYFVFIFKRSDSKTRNDHNNYTNWLDETKNPLLYSDLKHYENWYNEVKDDGDYCNTNYQVPTTPITRTNYESYNKNIINQGAIKFNGMNRIKEKMDSYFGLLQKHQHKLHSDNENIMIYSFSLDPKSFEPSGSANLTGLNRLTFEFGLTTLPSFTDDVPNYNFELNLYQVNYNIFRVVNGMGYTVFDG